MARYRLPLAAVLSCAIYFIPFVGPHMISFLWEWLLRRLTHGTDKSLAWVAVEVGAVLILQSVAGLTWYWILGRPLSLRPLALLVVVPASVYAMNYLFLAVLPARYLIEADEAPERATWPVACTVPNESLATIGRRASIVPAGGEPVFVQNSVGRFARLRVTEAADGRVTCEVAASGIPLPIANASPIWVGDRGEVLTQRNDMKTGVLSWEWIAAPGATPRELPIPGGPRHGSPLPVIARDASAVGWVASIPDSGQPPAYEILVQPLAARGVDVKVPLDRLGRASFVLLEVDTEAREVLLALNERSFAVVAFDGTVRWGPTQPDGVQPLSNTFRRVGTGWVAWDGYKENDGYVIAWSTPAGQGQRRVPTGRGVTDVGVHPAGRLIAFSTTTTLSIGSVQDAVVVLNAADGGEVFRRKLPRYARSTVAFPTPALFAYTEWDGQRAEVRVLRCPPCQASSSPSRSP